jgi:Fur family transcriptional regulator, peroxide stress response regulator
MESPEVRLNRLAGLLHAEGGRVTAQRLAILSALLADSSHPSVEEIYQQVKAGLPAISLATVYKTLALLAELNEVQELRGAEEVSRYDGRNPRPHPHMICTVCGVIADAETDELEELARVAPSRGGQWRLTERLDFWGVCPQCQE